MDRYPWSGHSALRGRGARPWQAVDEVLAHFGSCRGIARGRYRDYVAAGVAMGRRPDLQGGGLRRSLGAWEAVSGLRRGREHGLADERILGSGTFVEAVHRSLPADRPRPLRAEARAQLPRLIARLARVWGIGPVELAAGSRRRLVAQARAVAGHFAVRALGLPLTLVALHLGVTPSAIRLGLPPGERLAAARGLTARNVLRG